jgi:hypothetical protein
MSDDDRELFNKWRIQINDGLWLIAVALWVIAVGLCVGLLK